MVDIEKLRAARDLLARPGGWIQGTSARDADGYFTLPKAPDAVCFCVGAAYEHVGGHYRDLETATRDRIGLSSIVRWNDTPGRTQAEVVAVLDAVIAANTPA